MEDLTLACVPLDDSDLEVWLDNLAAKAAVIFLCFPPESLDSTRLEDVSGLATFVAPGDIPGNVVAVLVLPR